MAEAALDLDPLPGQGRYSGKEPLQTSTLTEPVEERIVVGVSGLPSPADIDRVDLAVEFHIGDLLAVGRVGRVDVVRVVVGELGLATPVGVEGVDLVVFPAVPVRVGYPAVLSSSLALAGVGSGWISPPRWSPCF